MIRMLAYLHRNPIVTAAIVAVCVGVIAATGGVDSIAVAIAAIVAAVWLALAGVQLVRRRRQGLPWID